MAPLDRLGLNPTLRITGERDQQGKTRWSAHFFTRHSGYRSIAISSALAQALASTREDRDFIERFSEEALEWLNAREMLVAEELEPPRYRVELPPSGDSISSQTLFIDPMYVIHSSLADGLELWEMASWQAPRARYAITTNVMPVFMAWSDGRVPAPGCAASKSLEAIGCLATLEQIKKRRRDEEDELRCWRLAMSETKRCFIPQLLRSAAHSELVNYCERIQVRGYLDGDQGVHGKCRSHVYDDPELRQLHEDCASLASAVMLTRLVPTYSFLAFYHGGGCLPMHRDPPHCPISISLCVAASDYLTKKWPLHLESPDGYSECQLFMPGDGLLFDGHHFRHGRSPMPKHEKATYLVLHFQRDLR